MTNQANSQQNEDLEDIAEISQDMLSFDLDDEDTPSQGDDQRSKTDRRASSDKRSGMDRRCGQGGYDGPERRESQEDRRDDWDRRRGPGRRRSDDRRAAEEGEMTDDQFELIQAIDQYKRANKRPFPSFTEVLEIIKALGYRKVADPQPLAPLKQQDKQA